MKMLSKIFLASLLATTPVLVSACGDDKGDDDGEGGAPATGGKTSTGGKDGTGGKDATGGEGGMVSTDPPFSVEQCGATNGPASAVTGYTGGGAFVDGNWLAGWTNFSTDSTPEDDDSAPTVEVNADIDADTTWTADEIYSLTVPVHVLDGATLTIEPGTLIKSGPDGSLIVSRGGMIDAVGTKDEPIVFTSLADNGSKAVGDWGGVLLLGNARNWNEEELIEGLAEDPLNYHGGDDDADSSGTLKYVRIEFGGTDIGNGNEINGLTMGSVGSGTTISYVQVNTTQDDGFEWFGGTVDADHLVVNNAGDDMFDGDVGWRGALEYAFGRHVNPLSGDPNGYEMDGDNDSARPVNVNTTVETKYVTLCGTGFAGLNVSYGAVLRENLQGAHDSVLFAGFDYTLDTRDSIADGNDVDIAITNSMAWGFVDGVGPEEDGDDDDDDGFDEAAWFEDEATNTVF